MIQKPCVDCGNVFEYEPPKDFQDNRKYCDVCGLKRKAEWEAKQTVDNDSGLPRSEPAPIQENKHDVVIQRVEKPHSFEFGPAGARHKIYYAEVKDLKVQIEELKAVGLYEEVGMNIPVEKI